MSNDPVERHIRTAFDYVVRVYEELHFLFQDLRTALQERDRNLQPLVGRIYGFQSGMDKPRHWLARYVSECWVDDRHGLMEGRRAAYLSATVSLLTPDDQPIEPLFSYGVVAPMNHPQAMDFCHQGVWYATANHQDLFSYRVDDNEVSGHSLPMNTEIWFRSKLPDGSYAWPKRGVMVIQPLTAIRDTNSVYEIAGKMVSLWNKYADQVARG